MTMQDVLLDYLDYLRDDLTRMESWDAEHYTDEDRQALRDKIQEAIDLEESITMSKHTPGPWTVSTHPDTYGAYIIDEAMERQIGMGDAEDNANIDLISAAPALLAALEFLLGLADTVARNQALSAIAKARGQA